MSGELYEYATTSAARCCFCIREKYGLVKLVCMLIARRLVARSLNLQRVFFSYVFDMHSAHLRHAMTSAGTSYFSECVLGKRRRDEDEADLDEADLDVKYPCKRRCIRPVRVR